MSNETCPYCQTTFFIKVIQCARPLLAPLTPEQELRDKLEDLTGESYIPIHNNYSDEFHKSFCGCCGAKMDGKDK